MKKFLLFSFLLLSLSFAAAKSTYSIPSATLDYYLQPDGTVLVTEQITYSLHGTFHELYVQKPPAVQISDASGYCTGAQCTFYTQMNNGWQELVLNGDLPSSGIVTANFNYKISNEILQQKDASQFFYQLWGDQWNEGVGTLTATLHFPSSSSEVTYFLHPTYQNYEVSPSSSTLKIISKNHPAKTYLEINALMPQDWFSNLPTASKYYTKQEIIAGEQNYAAGEQLSSSAGLLISLLFILLTPLALVIIYLLYGREKPLSQLGYEALYEHEPPSALSPSAAAILLEKNKPADSMTAEILLLAQRKCLSLEEKEMEVGGFLGKKKEKMLCITFLKEPSKGEIEPHQIEVYNFLKAVSNNGVLTSKDLYKTGAFTPMQLRAVFTSISKALDLKKYLNEKGHTMGIAVLCIALNIGFIVLNIIPARFSSFAILVFIENAIVLSLLGTKPSILGKWNDEGRVLEARWKNFEKFLNDMTLMKEKAPRDIILWENYLIYATAFGSAEKVLSALKVAYPEASRMHSTVIMNPFLFSSLHSSISTVAYTGSGGHSGGGFGGGMGGGGGGGGAR